MPWCRSRDGAIASPPRRRAELEAARRQVPEGIGRERARSGEAHRAELTIVARRAERSGEERAGEHLVPRGEPQALCAIVRRLRGNVPRVPARAAGLASISAENSGPRDMRSADVIGTPFPALSSMCGPAIRRAQAREIAIVRSAGRCGRDIDDVIRTSFGSFEAERLDPAYRLPGRPSAAALRPRRAAATRERLPQDAALGPLRTARGTTASRGHRPRPWMLPAKAPGAWPRLHRRRAVPDRARGGGARRNCAARARSPARRVRAAPSRLRRQPQFALRAAQLRGECARERDYVLGRWRRGGTWMGKTASR